MAEQKELFDGFLRLRNCRKCKRKLHVDPNDNYKTRLAGLCYACVRKFEKCPHWDVDKFINGDNVAVNEFMEEAEEFESMLSSSEPYKRVVEYHFEVCGELISITDFGANKVGSERGIHASGEIVTYESHFVFVEEVRKNGQEDTHMTGCLSSDEDGLFSWAEGEDSFIENHSQKLADAICQYLNTHGIPKDNESAGAQS